MRAATAPFAILSVLLTASWMVGKFSQFLAPPSSEHLAIRLIAVWSFYPGALIWLALLRWCRRQADTWGERRTVRVFWSASLATAPIPLLIHWALIAHDEAAGVGLYSHLDEGKMLVLLLPIVSVILSSLVTVGLARTLDPTRESVI